MTFLPKPSPIMLFFPKAAILDLGCGNGLCGVSLGKKGLKNLVGLDISPKSLQVAQTRGCYKSLQKADLLEDLPLEDNHFDVLLCIGTTSYLSKSILYQSMVMISTIYIHTRVFFSFHSK